MEWLGVSSTLLTQDAGVACLARRLGGSLSGRGFQTLIFIYIFSKFNYAYIIKC